MKIAVLCGVSDGGKPCGRELGAIDVSGFPGPEWYRGGNYERLRSEERFHSCDKHNEVQIHEADLLRLALKPPGSAIMAKRVRVRRS